jgi:hypothetical protein
MWASTIDIVVVKSWRERERELVMHYLLSIYKK